MNAILKESVVGELQSTFCTMALPMQMDQIHLGHALNKCLKDFIVKSKTMAGM